jgi:hypothetical protein
MAFAAALAAVCLLLLCFTAPPVHAEPNHPQQEVGQLAGCNVQADQMALSPIPAVLLEPRDPQPSPCRYCENFAATMSLTAMKNTSASPPVHVDWPAM